MKSLLLFAVLLVPQVACGQAQLPDAPKPKVADKSFWLVTGTLAAAKATDVYATRRCLDHPNPCIETNPLLGRHPSAGKQVIVNSLFLTGEVGLSYFLKWKFRNSRHWYLRNLWLVEPVVAIKDHTVMARRGARL